MNPPDPDGNVFGTSAHMYIIWGRQKSLDVVITPIIMVYPSIYSDY